MKTCSTHMLVFRELRSDQIIEDTYFENTTRISVLLELLCDYFSAVSNSLFDYSLVSNKDTIKIRKIKNCIKTARHNRNFPMRYPNLEC